MGNGDPSPPRLCIFVVPCFALWRANGKCVTFCNDCFLPLVANIIPQYLEGHALNTSVLPRSFRVRFFRPLSGPFLRFFPSHAVSTTWNQLTIPVSVDVTCHRFRVPLFPCSPSCYSCRFLSFPRQDPFFLTSRRPPPSQSSSYFLSGFYWMWFFSRSVAVLVCPSPSLTPNLTNFGSFSELSFSPIVFSCVSSNAVSGFFSRSKYSSCLSAILLSPPTPRSADFITESGKARLSPMFMGQQQKSALSHRLQLLLICAFTVALSFFPPERKPVLLFLSCWLFISFCYCMKYKVFGFAALRNLWAF